VTVEYTAAPTPNLILVTHEHGDHFNVDILNAVSGDATIVVPQAVMDKLPDTLKAKAQVLANGASATVADIPIEAVPAYNISPDRLKYHPKERQDNGYVLTLGGERVYIAGDTEDTPEMRALQNIDVAFLPMNLPYTMDVDHAADAARTFRPGIVYPYHYGESDVNAFKTQVADASDVRLLKWY
jgi:L-ascorbate metabolism protein UlaG (beta-lactamase superfamily)